jgi:nitroreductase
MKMDLKTVDHLLTTTRSVRKRLDFSKPVEPSLLEECIEIAFQAPTGSNAQGWHVVVVTDEDKKRKIADYYCGAFEIYTAEDSPFRSPPPDDDLRAGQQERVYGSAGYLAHHMYEAPALVLYCIEGRVERMPPVAQASVYGSVIPAAWSFMLAARARGLGSAWTTLHIMHEKEIAEMLGIPDDVTQAVLLPVAYFTGSDFKPAKRLEARSLTSWNEWGKRRFG